MITKTKDEFYKEHSSIFFMFDLFPEKRDDYNIPDSLNEFMIQKIVPLKECLYLIGIQALLL